MTEFNAVAFPGDFALRKAYSYDCAAGNRFLSLRRRKNYSRFDLICTYVVIKDP